MGYHYSLIFWYYSPHRHCPATSSLSLCWSGVCSFVTWRYHLQRHCHYHLIITIIMFGNPWFTFFSRLLRFLVFCDVTISRPFFMSISFNWNNKLKNFIKHNYYAVYYNHESVDGRHNDDHLQGVQLLVDHCNALRVACAPVRHYSQLLCNLRS